MTEPNKNALLTTNFVEFLRQNAGIKLVILAGYWQLQAEGGSYNKSPRIFKDEQYDGSGLPYNKISFERGLKRLVEMFPERQFVIVEDVPTGHDLEIAIAARVLHIRDMFGGEKLNTARFGIPRRSYEAQLASYRPILQSVAGLPNVTIFPLIDRLCDEEFCAGARGGVLLFLNGDHLSAAGGKLFVEAFSLEFARLQRVQK